MSTLWVDDFSTDHFIDGRYVTLVGTHGTDFGSGSFYLDGDGLHAHSVAWSDSIPIGSPTFYMELEIDSWSSAPFARIGLMPPGGPAENPLVLVFTRASADAGLNIELNDPLASGANIAHFYSFAATVDPPDSPLVLRLAVDEAGMAYFGVSCHFTADPDPDAPPGAFLPIGGSAHSLAGFAKLSEATLGALASWLPYVSLSSSAGRRALKWQYGASGDPAITSIDGLLTAGLGSLGQMRVRPVN